MFRDDLNDLKDRHTTRFTLLHVMDEEVQDVEIMNGRLDAEKLESLSRHGLIDPASADAIYICGPEPMIRAASAALAALGVEAPNPLRAVHPRPRCHARGRRPRPPRRNAAASRTAPGRAPRWRSSSTGRAGRSRSTPPPTRCSRRGQGRASTSPGPAPAACAAPAAAGSSRAPPPWTRTSRSNPGKSRPASRSPASPGRHREAGAGFRRAVAAQKVGDSGLASARRAAVATERPAKRHADSENRHP
jgi:hypothetical protein